MAKKRRLWNKYHFKVGNKTVHGGRTTSLKRRERDHRRTWPDGHIVKIGRRTTKEGAIRWEKRHGF